jgi:hypothetical protein
MTVTPEEAKALVGMAGAASSAMEEGGASAVLVLWSHKVGTSWTMMWARAGSPYECLHLADRYSMIDRNSALAAEINKPDSDGENWKESK